MYYILVNGQQHTMTYGDNITGKRESMRRAREFAYVDKHTCVKVFRVSYCGGDQIWHGGIVCGKFSELQIAATLKEGMKKNN